ncbi:TonB-dependent receptor [Lutibacter sp. HS1-25]|uniref:TonB-dependent receptor n=1 Tax=Lutibacter sp. HS1-25 TaxID=2485000 RepID=UPI001013172F|nr:TonB-dependent receptor [Lutibacter sp. HS1-25]RXP53636.1 TonB-dependent receptor [Lutibacter sp. HS1-25]
MKKFMTLVFIAVSYISIAQQKISGIITDANNNPIANAAVYIEEIQKGTSTNDKGFYEISNLPSQPIHLTVEYIGFETQARTIKLQQPETVLNFILKESVFKMEEIIISTPFNKLQNENVMKVEKATIQQLKNKGAATLADGITTIPGVSQVSTGTGIGKPVIRGLRGNRVLVYAQGIRLENQQFGDEHGLGIDESSIESVEVIKGPASLLYGSDALGGVLYFKPLQFADQNTMNVSAGHTFLSNTLGNSTFFGAKNSYKKWKFLANGSFSSNADYEIPSAEKVTNTRFNENVFNAAMGYSDDFMSSSIRFNYNQASVGIPEEIGIQNSNKTPLLPYQDLTTKMLSLNNIFFLNNSKITTVFGYTQNDRKEFEEHDHDDHAADLDEDEVEHPSLFLKLNTFSYDIKWKLPNIKNYESIVGVQGMWQKNSNFGEEILIPNAKTNDIGILYTGTYDWENNNSIQGGIRFDFRDLKTEEHEVAHEDEIHIYEALDKNFKNISASLGYKTNIFKHIVSRFNVATGFKAPNLAELTSNGVHHGSNRFEVGNPDLTSEQNVQLDIALEYDKDHLEIFANGFYNKIYEYIFISPTGEVEDNYDVYKYVQENAALYGGEFGFHLHPHPLDWLHLQSSFEIVIGKQDNGNYLPLIPANQFTNTLRAEYSIKKWLSSGFASVTLQNVLAQNNVSEFETASKGYNLLNFGVGGTFNVSKVHFNLGLNLNNALNKTYISHLSRLKGDEIPNIGRNFIVSLKFDF